MNNKRESKFKSKSFFFDLMNLIICQILTLFRRMNKVILHFVTKKCELERICENERIESVRIKKMEKCLQSSKNSVLKNSIQYPFDGRICNEEEVVLNIMKAKNIPTDSNINLRILMKDGLMKINAYNRLVNEVESIRSKKFSFENKENSDILFKIWSGLKGDSDRLESKITKRWQEIGFQGNDPSTDFRGMGLLGLNNLYYFVEKMNDLARSVYSKSLHPKYGYPLAIVGINITSWIHKLLLDGYLKTHFYNDSELLAIDKIKIENLNKIYCLIFSEFDQFWFKNEPNVMEFEKLSRVFLNLIIQKLQNDPHTIIRENFLAKLTPKKHKF